MICPNCQSENRDTAKFCDNCGTALQLNCPNCGTENRPGAKFCDNCGHNLKAAPISDSILSATPGPQPALLDQFIPPELAAKLTAARRRGTMAGERRIVTMLFCDVAGSTAASEQLDPEEWSEIMNVAFEFMIAPIYHYEGTVARLMGDAILAFFGAPIAHEDDPQRAILAGLEIVKRIQQYRLDVKSEWGIEINARVGINSGLVVVGAVGSDLRLEYTAMGDAINLAARMEQTAEPGSVQIAEDTHRLVAPLFEFEELGGIMVKGKAEPVPSFRVLRRKARPERLRGIKGLDATLVGRSGEWGRLEEAVGNLRSGIGGIVCLLGEAGLGKSRLIQELRATIEESASEFTWYETASLSYESDRPYALFQRLVRRMVGATESDSPERLQERLEAIVTDIPGEDEAPVRQLFAALFGLDGPEGQPPLEGEAFKGRLFTVMRGLWKQRVAQRPAVLVFDDLHWSDQASVALLLHMLPLCEQNPLLILWAMRPERQAPGWQVKQVAETEYGYRYSEIALQPLSKGQSGELVDSLLTISDLPPQLRTEIQEKSEGNPFFVEEVVRTLIDSGVVVRDETGRHWLAAGKGEGIEIPGNVQTLLTARIDRLQADVKQTLQLAAVVGRFFYYRVLARIAEVTESLDSQLLALERAELIREAARLPELEYLFRHSLTQEAAYSTILLKERRRYHRQVAEALEVLFGERRKDLAGSIADHYFEARVYEEALDYYRVAGDEAFRLHAAAEAVEHYSQAITCAAKVGTGGGQLVHLYIRRGRSFELNSRYDDALDNYQEMMRAADESGERALELASLTAQCIVRATMTPLYDSQLARELAERALILAQELGDRAAEARVLWSLLLVEFWGSGDIRQGLAYGERSLAIARELGLKEQMGYTLTDMGYANNILSRFEAAQKTNLEARAIWLELGNAPMLADSYGQASIIYLTTGRFEDSIEAAHDRVRIGKSIGNEWNQAAGFSQLALNHSELGEFGPAIAYAEKGSRISEQTGNFNIGGYLHIALISVYLMTGASELAQQSANVIYANRDKFFLLLRPMTLAAWAHVQIRQGEFIEAERILNETQEITNSENTAPIAAVPPRIAFVHLLLAMDNAEAALEKANNVLDRLHQTGMRLQLAETLWLKGKALIGLGKQNQVEEALLESLSLAEEINARRILWQILATLAKFENQRGNTDKAGTLRAQAGDIIAYIADHTGSEILRASFLSLPEVKSLLAYQGH